MRLLKTVETASRCFTQFIVLTFILYTYCDGKVFSLCELSQTLFYEQKVPMEQLPMWLCIAYYESKYNTSAVGPSAEDFGLFQISRLYWCDSRDLLNPSEYKGHYRSFNVQPPNVCNTTCSSFLDDDITDDMKCVNRIFKDHQQFEGDGYKAWAVYPICQKQWPLVPEWCFPPGVVPDHLSSRAYDDV